MCLGIPGEVVRLEERDGLKFGDVRFAGITRQVCMECVAEVRVGEFVLVHVGMAIARLDAAEAARTLEALQQLGLSEERET